MKPRDGVIIIVQEGDDERFSSLRRLMDLSSREGAVVTSALPPFPGRARIEDEVLTIIEHLAEKPLLEFPGKHRRKSKWRRPDERGRPRR